MPMEEEEEEEEGSRYLHNYLARGVAIMPAVASVYDVIIIAQVTRASATGPPLANFIFAQLTSSDFSRDNSRGMKFNPPQSRFLAAESHWERARGRSIFTRNDSENAAT